MIDIFARVKSEFSGAKFAKQAVFATAVALTNTAKEAQADEVYSLKSNFQLRGRWFEQGNKYGIKIKSATKSDLSSAIYTQADWLELHETGGIKTPRGKDLAIPTENVRRNKRDIIVKSQRPRNLAKAFIITTKSNHKILVMRKGRGKKKPLVILYDLNPKAIIKKRVTFYEPVLKSIERNFNRNFESALRKALASAR